MITKTIIMSNIYKSFSISDQIFFTQRLSLLLNSNTSLTESLNIMSSMDTSKKHKEIYNQIIKNCLQGISLYKSIIQSKVKFDSFLITMIKNGEHSGTLALSLMQISKKLEKRNELKKKIIGTLVYPIFIFIVTICMSIFLVLYIFPKILPMLNSLNIKLPLLTIIVKNLYEYSISYGLITIIIIVLLMILIIYTINSFEKIKYKVQYLLINAPIIGMYIKLNILSSLCDIGETFLSSGRSLSEFHNFAHDSLTNIAYKRAFKIIHLESIQGISFSNSMKQFPKIFSIVMIDMCSIGERTGDLALMLGHCARIFEQDLDIFFKKFSSLIEPLLMIFMGLIVGSIALSIILPIYEITNHLTH